MLLSDVTNTPNPMIQVLRVGKFTHPVYGVVDITPKDLAELKMNFDSRTFGQDVMFDYFHDNGKEAACWPKHLELREGGNELWASQIDWTPRGRKAVQEKELRYFSPEFGNWKNPETNETHRNVLMGGGLTNRPFIKNMAPIMLSEDQLKKALADDTEIQACVANLVPSLMSEGHTQEQAIAIAYSKCGEQKMAASTPDENLAAGYNETTETEGDKMEDKKRIAELELQLAQKNTEIETLKTDKTVALSEVKTTKEALKLSEEKVKEAEKVQAESKKLSEFEALMKKGKAVAAQKDAFMAGDTVKFAELAQPVNLESKGSNENGAGEAASAEDKLIKFAEELVAKEKISMADAQSRVLREHPDLAKQL